MQALDVDDAHLNARLEHKRLQLIGEIDEIGRMFGLHANSGVPASRGCERLHAGLLLAMTAAANAAGAAQREESALAASKSSDAGEHQVRFL
jgi:hypothetical protein